jgi:predicted DsbA family dithiol-disulfide isomerase
MNSIRSIYPLNTARIELIEFGDFGSLKSRQARKLIDAIVKMLTGDITYHYRHYPNPNQNDSLLAAFALEAAKRQGQFLPMYEAMLSLPSINCSTLIAQALQLGFDQQQFMDDLADDDLHTIIKQDWQVGYRLGVVNTPTLFVDGCRFYGKLTKSRLVPFIHFHLNRHGRLIIPQLGTGQLPTEERISVLL